MISPSFCPLRVKAHQWLDRKLVQARALLGEAATIWEAP